MSDNVWPLSYNVDWTSVNEIQNAAQIVDGLWALTADGAKPVLMGYDRNIIFGDLLWQDYEVTTELRVDSIKNRNGVPLGDPAVGLLLRWQGSRRLEPARPASHRLVSHRRYRLVLVGLHA